MSEMVKTIKMCLVVDTNDGYDESSIRVIDLDGVQHIAPKVIVLRLKEDIPVEDGGQIFSLGALHSLISEKLRQQFNSSLPPSPSK